MGLFSKETKEEKLQKQKLAYEGILEKYGVPENHIRVVIGQSKVHNIYNCPAVLWIEGEMMKTLIFGLNPKLVESELEDYMFLASQPYVDFIRFDGTGYPDWARQSDYIKELFLPCVELAKTKGGLDYTRQMYWIGTMCVYAPSLANCLTLIGRPLSAYDLRIENKKRIREDGAIPADILAEYELEKQGKKKGEVVQQLAEKTPIVTTVPETDWSGTQTVDIVKGETLTVSQPTFQASTENEGNKKFKVLMVNGSPHKEGSTYTALVEMAKVLEANGVETEILQVGSARVSGCMACGFCHKEGYCVFDDIVRVASKKFEECDGLVVGSPVYYASANGTLISFLDRLFYSSRFDKSMKVGAAIVSARRGGLSATFDQLNKYFTISGMPVASGQYWNSIHGNNAEEAKQDLEGLQSMRTLGQNMAFLLNSIAYGKERDGLPEKEPKIATNFIR